MNEVSDAHRSVSPSAQTGKSETRSEALVRVNGPGHSCAQVRAVERTAFRAGMDRVETLRVVRQRHEVERRRQARLDSLGNSTASPRGEPIGVPRTDRRSRGPTRLPKL